MKRHYLLIFALVLTLIAGCSSVPTKDIQIDAQTDPKANMSGYNTYAWLATAAILNDPNGQWEPLQFDADSEVKFLIDGELRELLIEFGPGRKSYHPEYPFWRLQNDVVVFARKQSPATFATGLMGEASLVAFFAGAKSPDSGVFPLAGNRLLNTRSWQLGWNKWERHLTSLTA